MALNLEKQLTFYGSYHHNPVNVAIHMTCVPMIMLTYFLLGTNTPPLLPSSLFPASLPPTLGTISTLIFLTFYLLLEPTAAALLAPLLIYSTRYFHILTSSASTASTANWAAGILFVLSWVAQFIGHGIFEGRAPALLDNVVQAVFLAPCFVWLEFLFWFGYRPELQVRVDREVQREIGKWKGSKAGAVRS